jgi:phage terminase large subunit
VLSGLVLVLNAQFPSKLSFLFSPKRYKVARGGRGSGKSWGFARALLILGAKSKLRILCAREVQRSIKDSVHKLLSDQIEALGLGAFYEVLESTIRGKNGTEFLFAGLSSLTIESIKSFEGVDVCWVEEAQSLSDRSWVILIPTIRKDGSEIWVTFNPDLDDDPTYRRFVETPPANCVSIEINYSDNPWFPSVLEDERQHCKRTMSQDDYENIWEGKCKSAVTGAIYAGEIRDAIEKGRVCNVPYDPQLKVHQVWDLGWNDQMSIILAQRHVSEIRVIEYIEENHKTLDYLSADLKLRRYNWGKVFMPHDGGHGNILTGASAVKTMQKLGWDMAQSQGTGDARFGIPNIPIETGIKQARMLFPRVYFDRTKAALLVSRLKRYKRNVPTTTDEPSAPVHDINSHGADDFRYLSLVVPQMSNEDMKPIVYPKSGVI